MKQAQIAKLQRLTEPAGNASLSVGGDDRRRGRHQRGYVRDFRFLRRVMRASKRPLRANEVMLILDHCGFLISRYVDLLSAVTTVLRRLAARGELHVVGVTEEAGLPTLGRVRKTTLRGPESPARRSRRRIRRPAGRRSEQMGRAIRNREPVRKDVEKVNRK